MSTESSGVNEDIESADVEDTPGQSFHAEGDLVVNARIHHENQGPVVSNPSYHAEGDVVINGSGPADTAAWFDSALSGAESLLRGVDRARVLTGIFRVVEAIVLFAAPLAFQVGLTGGGGASAVVVALVVVAAVAVIVALEALVLRPLARQIRRDERAMTGTIDELRELLGSVAAEGGWSRSTYRQMRIRIERFPL